MSPKHWNDIAVTLARTGFEIQGFSDRQLRVLHDELVQLQAQIAAEEARREDIQPQRGAA